MPQGGGFVFPITKCQLLDIASINALPAGSQSVLSAIVLLLFCQNWYKYAVLSKDYGLKPKNYGLKSQDYGLKSQDCGSKFKDFGLKSKDCRSKSKVYTRNS
jgi:hypothetical protein